MGRNTDNTLKRTSSKVRGIKPITGLVVLALIAVAGVYYMRVSQAAPVAISLQAEAGTASNGAVSVSDSSASGGRSMKFARPVTPDPVTPPPAGTGKLTWRPPTLTNPTTINVTSTNRSLKLDGTKDYNIKVGRVKGEVSISGGRNVVIIGGEVDPMGADETFGLDMQTGHVYIEGVKLTGDSHEGFTLDQRKGATVTMQNIKIDMITGTKAGYHADLVQTWAGPKLFRIDRFDGTSNYQCMMIHPTQYGTLTGPFNWDFRNMVTRGNCAYYTVNVSGLLIKTTNVYNITTKNQVYNGKWSPPPTKVTSAPSPLIGTPGADYVSPGYAN